MPLLTTARPLWLFLLTAALLVTALAACSNEGEVDGGG